MRAFAAAAVVILGACAQPDADSAATAVADTTDYMAIENAAAQSFMAAWNAKDAAAVAVHYADDAVALRPDSTTVTGKAAIQQADADGFAGPIATNLTITPREAVGNGDWYWATGDVTVILTIPGAPEPVTSPGKYMSIVKRSADGTWKIHRLIWNDNTAAM